MESNTQHSETAQIENKNHGRLMLILLLVFFAAPLLVVMMMYKYDWHPKGQSNGELISPARQLDIPHGLQNVKLKVVDKTVWGEKWNMVYVTDLCDAVCETQLYQMRQIHTSLAKEIERVQRVLIVKSGDLSKLEDRYPDLIILNQPNAERLKLSQQFDIGSDSAAKSNRIFLVDPLGNLMMSYPGNTAAKAIRQDITKLLRYSWAG